MNKAAKRRITVFVLGLFAALLVTAVPLWQHLSQDIVTGGPHIQMVIEQDRSSNTLPNGHYVGANYVYCNDGNYQYENIPSLQGVWQLDEPYAERSSIEIENDTKFVSIFCAVGTLRRLPNSISIVRFDQSVVEGNPGTSPDWSEGEIVSYERHGNYYRIYNPTPGVYVARTVWDNGVLENAWLLIAK